jgi:hypothetical protein
MRAVASIVYDEPRLQTCHVVRRGTGGVKRSLGLTEGPSRETVPRKPQGKDVLVARIDQRHERGRGGIDPASLFGARNCPNGHKACQAV